jgi:hypothetical protein
VSPEVLNDPNSSMLAMALSYISFSLIIVTTISLILEPGHIEAHRNTMKSQ